MTHPSTSIVDILRWRANSHPELMAYRYLLDGEFEEATLTYGDLDRRARSIAALLQATTKPGERALIIFPPGLDFIAAYFGCLYAKILAVPVYPLHAARPEANLPALLRIAADARPAVALLTLSLLEVIKSRREIRDAFGDMELLATGDYPVNNLADRWQQPMIVKNDLAFLQYTSGSTTAPRGVMISHGNLIHNMDHIAKCYAGSVENHGVIWLPPYHDMGLIGGLLQPVYSGIPFTLMPHMMFLQRPFRWLQTISRFHATISGGPNFAYELCIRKIKPEQRKLLDLSSWEIAFNGAEPVHHKTLDQFAEYFAPCGFRPAAFMPCYGLAESTLMVTRARKATSPLMQNVVNSGLQQNQAIVTADNKEDTRTLVSCGQKMSDLDLRIVNRETLTACKANEVGEVWVSGPSVACGYWSKPSETEFTFGARLSDSMDGPFLRTGDLGFLHEGELYITGRIKNLIISEGKNHYPHDIERTVELSHPAIRLSGCAVFSVYKSLREKIIVFVELEQRFAAKTDEVIKNIRGAISTHHGLHAHDIILTNPGGIPKTTSGKIKHFLCKEYYLGGTLEKIRLT
jgi:acyl-CoA synthetase (AMP-forming)/AMP-acid ligase II